MFGDGGGWVPTILKRNLELRVLKVDVYVKL